MMSYEFLGSRYFTLCKNKHCKLVWLQHGVGKDDISKVYNASKGHDLVTLATKPEYEDRLAQEYGYKPSQLELTGLARFDLLENKSQKLITIFLTWRKYARNLGVDKFSKSKYCSVWNDLIISSDMINLAKKYGYKIQFCFHHLIDCDQRKYILEHKCSGVTLVSDKTYKEIVAESALLITDYSSVAFDMAYLNKPVVYYHKDADEFFSGKHSYTAGYFDYERDGFGEIVCDKNSLLKTIEQYLQTGCQMNEFYLNRVKNTFVYQDKKNRERIWDKVKNNFLR